MMAAKRYGWWRATALGGILFLCAGIGPVFAGEIEEKIKTLEEQQRANAEELERLKGEQLEMRKEATAAAEKLPTFQYRPGAGVTIEAADGSWGFRPRIRWHYRLTGFPGPGSIAKNGFSQFDLSLRRIYPYMTFYWDKRFYEVDFQMNLGDDRSIIIQKAEFHTHFEKLNPYLPEFTVGPRVSAFFNRHDTNWGSGSAGFFERTMFQTGAGIGAGSQNNAMAFDWHNIPIGPGRITVLEAIISNQGLRDEQAQERPNSDKRTAHLGIQVEPFNRIKNQWIQGIDFGFSAHLENMHPGQDNRDFFRVRTAEDNTKLRLIEVANNMSGFRWYLTPGFGWKIGPYWLRVAAAWNKGHVDSPVGGKQGPLVQGRMFRVGHELFLWSPKGLLTGSANTAGSVMAFTSFERDDYTADGLTNRNGLRACSSTVVNGNCHGAYAWQNNVGMWYFIRPGLSVGWQYAFYHVNKIGRGGADIVSSGTKAGQDVDFQSLQAGLTARGESLVGCIKK
ncbi:MAG TPA: hypothetical protein VNO43_05820 [Candidatus Eisenbacteria bacterium]|nr:hypothetical protein [Candidatus Eisenbacteria bacterium]